MSNTEDRTAETTRSGEAPACQGQGRTAKEAGHERPSKERKEVEACQKNGVSILGDD